MLAWIVLIIAIAALLMMVVERILKRLNIRPERPEEMGGGARELLDRVEQWQRDHERRRDQR